MEDLKNRGTAIIVVSHDMQTVLKLCDRVYIMQNGSFVHSGFPVDMVNLFYAMMGEEKNKKLTYETIGRGNSGNLTGVTQSLALPVSAQDNLGQIKGLRRGNRKVEIVGLQIADINDQPVRAVRTGESIYLDIFARVQEYVDDLAFGFQITDRMNNVVFGLNSFMKTKQNIQCRQNELVQARFTVKVNLFQGLYTFAVAASDCNLEVAGEIYDFIEGSFVLEVLQPEWRNFHGQAELPTDFNLFRNERS